MNHGYSGTARRRTAHGCWAVIGIAAATSAWGDATSVGAPQASLDEVVVTAQKRSESLQTVPLSVAVITAQDLERTGAFGTADYASLVPNVAFNSKAGGDGRAEADNLVIRGVTGGDTTARYIDDAAVPPSIDLKVVDVARIEVLRGPQGTLYGASSMGGATMIVTNEPSLNAFSADTSARTATVDHGTIDYRGDGVVNLPVVADVFGLRLVGYYDDRSGIFDRIVGQPGAQTTEHRVDPEHDSGLQVKGKWAVADGWTVSPFFAYQQQIADGAHLADYSPNNFYQYRIFGLGEPLEDTLAHSSVKVKFSGNAFDFVSATSYTHWTTHETEDASEYIDYAFDLATPIPSPIRKDIEARVFQQEMRISSTSGGPFGWLGGVYYTNSSETDHYRQDAPGIGQVLGVDSDLLYSGDDVIRSREIAGFGELSYALTEQLKAIAGTRWFHSSLDAELVQNGIVNGGLTQIPGSQSENGLDPKAELEYQATADAMMYVSAAKGYRPGGTNTAIPQSQCGVDAPSSFNSDSLWTYETGAKTTWLDRRIRLNGALFWIDWSHIQQQVLLPCGFAYTTNVGAARNRGAELELSARPLDSLTLSSGLGYTDAVITKGAPNVAAVPGDRVEQVPKVTGTLSAEYHVNLTGQTSGFLRGGYQYQSKSFTSFDQTDPLRIRAASNLLDLRLGIQHDAWRVSLFADNVTNDHVNYSDTTSLAAELPGRPRYATNRPRTIGIEGGYHFGN